MSQIESKGIRFIRHFGGLVAGDPERIEIHTYCDVLMVNNPEDVALVNSLVKEAKRLKVDTNSYLEYKLVEEYDW